MWESTYICSTSTIFSHGYIYPKEDRPLRDLLRKRAHRVRQQIRTLERVILAQVFDHTSFQLLETIIGVGKILALTIYLETGQITRFRKPGDYLSYSRCVGSSKFSNQKKKGEANRKKGNKYLAWAFIEAAIFALRWDPLARRFYQGKQAKRGSVVAKNALAHKLSRASYCVLRNQVRFSSAQLFA